MGRIKWSDDFILHRLINNKSKKAYWNNIHFLRRRPSEGLFLKCVELTKSTNPRKRTIGIDILAQLSSDPRPYLSQTLKVFFDLLKTENDSVVLMSLLYAIGHNNEELNKRQLGTLCSFSGTKDDLVKEGLVYSLLGIEKLEAIETLIKLSSDKLSHIRDWATFGLGNLIDKNNKQIREALWNRINDKHQDTKLEAIFGLAKRKDTRINDIIQLELQKGEYGTLLLEAIIETGDKGFLPLLRKNLKTLKDSSNINPEWIKDLKNCISELSKLTKQRNKKND
jgi:HEAT repeat protein